MISSGIVGTVAKFMSATHIGIAERPFFGAVGAFAQGTPAPMASTASASFPLRSMIVVKSYVM